MSEGSPLVASTYPINGSVPIDIDELNSNIQEDVNVTNDTYDDQESVLVTVNPEDSGEGKSCLTCMCELMGHGRTAVVKCACCPCILIANVIRYICACLLACIFCHCTCTLCCYCLKEGPIKGTQSCLEAENKFIKECPQNVITCISGEINSLYETIRDHCKNHKVIATLIFIFVFLISPVILVIAIVVCVLLFPLCCCCPCVCYFLLTDHEY